MVHTVMLEPQLCRPSRNPRLVNSFPLTLSSLRLVKFLVSGYRFSNNYVLHYYISRPVYHNCSLHESTRVLKFVYLPKKQSRGRGGARSSNVRLSDVVG
jgi:hypothetical protein